MWKLVDGRGRCNLCGALVTRSWKYFKTPLLSTACVCESCAKDV